MADYRLERSLGSRIAAARKARGIRSTKALSELIGNGTVTEATLQNIETGRLTNLSLSQLLNIAFALKVAPSFLLAPIGRPDAKVDIRGLSNGLQAMSAAEFDAWLAGTNDGTYRSSSAMELNERTELEAFRALQKLARERARLQTIAHLDQSGSESGGNAKSWDRVEDRIAGVDQQIEDVHQYLWTAGWPLGELPGAEPEAS